MREREESSDFAQSSDLQMTLTGGQQFMKIILLAINALFFVKKKYI
jgi:hypothetical protein